MLCPYYCMEVAWSALLHTSSAAEGNACSKVRNKRMTKAATEQLLQDFWQAKAEIDADRGRRPARPGRFSGLNVLRSKSVFHSVFVRAHRALNGKKTAGFGPGR
jgi:hypothetical protein